MEENLRKAIMILIVIAALLSIVSLLTSSINEVLKANPFYFALAALLFIGGILVWIVSWGFLIRKTNSISYPSLLKVGFSSVYGSLTPVQLGTEILRSLQLKRYFNVQYQDSVSAAMVVKGLKFLVLLVVAFMAILLFFSGVSLNHAVLLAFMSGMAVVFLAVLLFLLPLNKNFGMTISRFFFASAKKIRQFDALGKFFKGYSRYLSRMTISALLLTFLFACLSFLLEFLALHSSFLALDMSLGLNSLAILMVLISILERTPFLPRGIGLVEIVAFQFLSMPGLANASFSVQQIGAAIIIFDIVRLVIPGAASIAAAGIFSRGLETAFPRVFKQAPGRFRHKPR